MKTRRAKSESLLNLDLSDQPSIHPKYEQLKRHVINEILAGRLKPGQALPSEQQLAAKLGLARMTVRQAMAALESDGIIRRVQRRGNFVEIDVRSKLRRGLDLLALIVPETREGFYPSLLHGFEDAAAKIQHRTVVCNTNDDPAQQAEIILQLLDQKVGGAALNPTMSRPTPAHHVRLLQERGIPVVLCHRGVEGVMAPLLALPFSDIGRMAGKTLIEQGHRHVAFVCVTTGGSSRLLVQAGLQEGISDAGDVSMELVEIEDRPIERREETCKKALERVFAQPHPPTAIFTTFDSLAEMIFFQLQQQGLRIPEDVSLLGFGGAWREGALLQRLTSIVVDEVATGRKAVSLLNEMRRGDRPIDDNTEYVMELSVSGGETVGPPPTAGSHNRGSN